MTRLRISPDLALPEEVVTSTLVVYGGKGMGKTNLGSVLVEELTKALLRWCCLDPMGVWWGLRHSKDGKGPGISCVILGGAHGDIPIEPTGGADIADLVVDEAVNTIIDISRHATGKMWTKGERIRFVTDYTTRLFERQGELVDGRRREPIIQILDEAARYIPQVIPANSPQLAACVGAWEQVCEEGRNIGLGVAFLTQRSARMNKSVSELADVMFAFRTFGPNSLAAIMDWLGEHVDKDHAKELARQVRALEVGQALVVSPGWLRVEKIAKIRERETFDSSATPKAGQRAARVSGTAAKPDLAKYTERMAATIERAKADDPKELRRRIIALEHAAQAVLPSIDPAAIDAAVTAERNRCAGILGAIVLRVLGFSDQIRHAAGGINEGAEALATFIKTPDPTIAAVPPIADQKWTPAGAGRVAWPKGPPMTQEMLDDANVLDDVRRRIDRGVKPRPAVAAIVAANGNLSGPEQRILDAIAWQEAIGIPDPPNVAVAFLARYSVNGGAYTNPRGKLRTRGLIHYAAGDRLQLTDAGRQLANPPTHAPTRRELHDRVMSVLDGPGQRILQPLLDCYPHAMTNESLAAAANYSPEGGAYTNPRGKLRTLGLIEYIPHDMVRATALLFPQGVR